MATLEPAFESKLRDAIMAKVVSQAQDIGDDIMARAEANWKEYASSNDYDIEFIPDQAEGPFIEVPDDRTVRISVKYGKYSSIFEWGVDESYEIEGNPLLHFLVEDTGDWVMTESVTHPGLPEARAIRDGFEEVANSL